MRINIMLGFVVFGLAFAARGESPSAGGVTNLIWNGSFELETNPGVADGWYGSQYRGDWKSWSCVGLPDYVKDLVGRENVPTIAVDPATAAHGDKSLKVVNPSKRLIRSPSHSIRGAGHRARGTVYTFSFFAKGAQPDMRITVELLNSAPRQPFAITGQWARYSFTFETAQDQVGSILFMLSDGPGTYWIDAIQLEAGAQAHPYVEHEASNHELMKRTEGK